MAEPTPPLETEARPDAARDEADPQPGDLVGAYEVVERIARGGTASVYRVRDTRDGNVAALKLMHRAARGELVARFRREFRAMSRLHHENVNRVYEWGLLGDRPWFTLEFVEGVDVREAIARVETLASAERDALVRSVVVQTARALAYVHDRGVVHRDVTPGNIRIRPDGVVKLTDFGLVTDGQETVTQVGEVMGTVAWVAPEQIANRRVDARADLYSLGAVMYALLTGRKPFQAHTLHGFLEKHLHQAPRPPRELDPTIPAELEAICLRLLEKDPDDRYASAAHLLYVLGERDAADDADHWPPRAVGRTQIKARLRDLLDEVAAHRPGGAVLLTGPSGLGKTRLLDLADAAGRQRGLPVAVTRCRKQDRPFGAFAAIWERLLRHAPRAPEAAPVDGESRPTRAPDVLEAVFAARDPDLSIERYRVCTAFRELLLERGPCVIILDRLEDADPATAELLEYLIRNTLELTRTPVLFVLGQETDPDAEPALSRHFGADGPVERFGLQPFTPPEVEELVCTILPPDDAAAALAGRLFAETEGSPVFVADMLRGLVDDGRIRRVGSGYVLNIGVDDIAGSHLPIPASLRAALGERLAPLPPDAIEIGLLLALARRKMDLDVLIAVAPFDEDRVMSALDALVDADIVRESRQGDLEVVELAHARFRDVLLERLTPDDRVRHHRRLGEILERENRYDLPLVVEDLAHHFEAANVPPKAFAYLVMTGNRHLALSLHAEALGFLDRALATEPVARPYMLLADADHRVCEVHLARSQATYHVGRWQDSLTAANEALRLAQLIREPSLEARVSTELGNQLRNQGRVAEAQKTLERALERADRARAPELRAEPLYHLGAIAWSAGDLSGAQQRWEEALRTAEASGDARALGQAYNGLGIVAFCKGQSPEARRLLERSAEQFEQLGMLAPLAITQVNLVELYLSMGILRKALQLAEQTLGRVREVRHRHGEALALAWRGQVLVELGQMYSGRSDLLEALSLSRELGSSEDEAQIVLALARVDLLSQDAEGAASWLSLARDLLARHDPEGIDALAAARQAQALVLRGDVEAGARALDEAPKVPRQWPHVLVRTEIERGRALELLGRRAEGQAVVEEALRAAQANGYRLFQLVAHDLLGRLCDGDDRTRHQMYARSFARSLAASLSAQEAEKFLDRGWGAAL